MIVFLFKALLQLNHSLLVKVRLGRLSVQLFNGSPVFLDLAVSLLELIHQLLFLYFTLPLIFVEGLFDLLVKPFEMGSLFDELAPALVALARSLLQILNLQHCTIQFVKQLLVLFFFGVVLQ